MNLLQLNLFLLFISLKFYLIFAFFCPNDCDCKNGGKFVSCKNKNFQIIPPDIPSNVQQLDLTKNIFNIIPSKAFIKWADLRDLKIDHCEIKSIDRNAFDGLFYLKNIFITNNDIQTLDADTFFMLRSLLHVHLSNNEFQSVPPLKSHSITRINLDGNHISNARIDDSFKLCTALRTLVLTNNNIVTLNSSDFINLKNTGLQSLMLKMNNLDYIHPLTFVPVKDSLQTLELEGNSLLTSVQLEAALGAFSGGSKLIFLDLKNTGLTNISRTFFQSLVSSHLNRLDISDNPKLSYIDEDAFHELNRIQFLLADKCKISSPNIKLTALSILKEIHLSHNSLVTCPHHLPGSLKKIDLSYNEIRQIIKDDFKSLSSLTYLNLASNAISSIEIESFTDLLKLTLLDLSLNRLETIQPRTFVSMSSLTILNLQQQNPCLKRISEKSLVLNNLLKLDLSLNCMDIETLKSSIFSDCPQLTDIILTSNNIQYLTDFFFKNCKNVSLLILSHNAIRGWSSNTFKPLTSTLINVDLSFNYLSNLSMKSSERNYFPNKFNKLNNVSLSNNHWNCSCTNIKWILSHKEFLQDFEKILCEQPNDKNGRKLFDVMENKACSFEVIHRGEKQSKASSSKKGVAVILSLIAFCLILTILYILRKKLRRVCRHLIDYLNKNPYSRMPYSNIPESQVFNNPILDEDIPDIDHNCLVIEDPNISISSNEDSANDWITSVRISNYEGQEDVVFLSQEKIISSNIPMKIINNLLNFDNRIAACHCPKLVVDYPPLDLDLLRIIIEERQKVRDKNDEPRTSHLFYCCDMNEDNYRLMSQRFEVGHIIEYNSSNFEQKLYDLF